MVVTGKFDPPTARIGKAPFTSRIRNDAFSEERPEYAHQRVGGVRIEIFASALAFDETFYPFNGIAVESKVYPAQGAELFDYELGVLFD